MRLSSAILLIFSLQFNAIARAQAITLHLKDAPIQAAFNEIKKQTGTIFLYEEKTILHANRISVNVDGADLSEILRICFENQPFTYKILQGTVVISPGMAPTGNKEDSLRTITGIVKADGQPLQGVSVYIKQSGKGTITDFQGKFEIKQVGSQSTLVFSSIGYETRELRLGTDNDIHVELIKAVSNLDETVIIGYGVTTKRMKTGSVNKVSSEQISKQPISNALGALQGQVAGLEISQGSGSPGTSFNVRLRGQNSIASGNDPLYVIDGVPFLSASGFGSSSTSAVLGGGSPLNLINPSDISSIEILKDADATAIYGSRGANGVILITTKKGTAGQTRIEAKVYNGAGQIASKFKMLDREQYLLMRHEAFSNDGLSPRARDYDLRGVWDTTRYTDWQEKLIGRTVHVTDAQLSLGGGTAQTNFRIAAGYRREGTVFEFSKGYTRASLHFNAGHTSSNNKFKMNLTAGFNADENELPDADLTYTSLRLSPVAPALYNPDGTLNWQTSSWTNPHGTLRQRYNSEQKTLMGNFTSSYQLLPSLSLKASLGYNMVDVSERSTYPLSSLDPAYLALGVQSTAVFGNKSVTSWIAEPQLVWEQKFERHSVSAIAGLSKQEQTNKALTQEASGFLSDEMIGNIKAASTVVVRSNNFINYKYFGFFGRLTYDFDKQYLLNLSVRRDGSSRFGPNKKYENFGAVGAGWIFSRNKIISSAIPFLSFGKLRASYGTTGNEQIGDYQYLDLWSTAGLPYGGNTVLLPQRLLNENYEWEVNRKFEYAIELGFLQDRLFFQFNYYRNRTSNQLVGLPLPSVTGFGSVQYNLPAVVQNTGIEIELTSVNIAKRNVKWTTSFNISIPRNKLVSYPGIESSTYSNTYEVGKSLFTRKSLHITGVDPATGELTFVDINGDGIITTPDDLVAKKELAKQFYGGLDNNLTIGNFSLGILVQFTKQTGRNYLSTFGPAGTIGNQPAFVFDRWTKPGDINSRIPFTQSTASAVYQSFTKAVFYGDNQISDASYIRLRNVFLEYKLPNNLVKKIHLDMLKFFVQGQNLLTITKFEGPDPETQSVNRLPPLRMITGGLIVNF